jgi:hypothetical protein
MPSYSMLDPHTAATAVGLVNSAFSSVKTALDLAKKTTDIELKHEVSKALDNVLELKVTVYELAEENCDLHRRLNERSEVKRWGDQGYYVANGQENDPYCPKCYEDKEKLIHLPPAEVCNRGRRRVCRVCSSIYWDVPAGTYPHANIVMRGDF